jgi:single-strand DNA-binding protein
MNVLVISGRVGQPPELRATQSGDKVLGFSVANEIGFGDRKKTLWFDCSLWGKRAEALAPHIGKGDKVVVSGEVQLVEYQKRDGTTGAKLSVRVNDIDLGGGNREGGGRDEGNRPRGGYDQSPIDRSPRGQDPRQHGGGGGVLQGPGGRDGRSFRHSIDDPEIPFLAAEGFDHQGCAGPVGPRARRFAAEA